MQSLIIATHYQSAQLQDWQQYLAQVLAPYLEQDNQPHPVQWQFLGWDEKLSIGEVRGLQARLHRGGKQNIYYVLFAQNRLLTAVQNSLLKQLEEPPEHARLILIVPTANSLLDTICSRCLLINDNQLASKQQNFPQLEALDFANWPTLTASQLAQTLIKAFTNQQKALKKAKIDINDRTLALQAFNHYLYLWTQALTTTDNLIATQRLVTAANQCCRLLNANVSNKNVFYFFAIVVKNPPQL